LADDIRNETAAPEAPAVTARPVRPAGPVGRRISSTFASLSEPAYRSLWYGMLLVWGSLNIQMVARAQLAYDLSRSAFLVGLVGAAFAPPVLLFSLFGGLVADRIDRKVIMQFTQLGLAANTLFVAVSITTDTVTIWHLISASFIQGLLFAFMMPARQAIVPQLVGKERMGNAVALNSSGMSLMTLVAPALGGVMYAQVGPELVYYVMFAFTAAAFVLTARLPGVGKPVQKSGKPIAELAEGLRYILRNGIVLTLLAISLVTAILAMPFRGLLPVLADEVFGRGPEAVGLMLSSIGVGALAGSLVFAGGVRKGRGLVLMISSIVSGIALVGSAVLPNYTVLLLFMVLIGVGDAARRALNNTLIMEQVDDAHRGRVMGVYMMNFGLMPVGTLPLAAMAEAWGIARALTVVGVMLTAFGAVFLVAARRVRRL